MNQKKKAELQRKLSMSAVPTPPPDLAHRIKAAIPDPLTTMKADRERFTNSIAFSMRVAASIVLLVTSVALSVHLMSRGESPLATTEKGVASKAAPAATQERENKSVVPQFADTAQITVTLADEGDVSTDAVAAPPPARLQAKEELRSETSQLRRDAPRQVAKMTEVSAGARNAATAGYIGGVATAAENERIGNVAAQSSVGAAAAPPAAPPPPPPVVVAESAPAASDSARSEAITMAAPVPSMAPAPMPVSPTASEGRTSAKTRAADFVYEAPSSRTIFGLSVDPGEFRRVKSMIESGRKPSDDVDVEAIVNHFAGATAPSMKAVRLQVEGSRVPVARNESLVMLRFTVDTAAAGRRSSATVGTDAKIEVILNRNALLRHRVIGNTGELEAAEGVLLRGSSVTGLVEMRLKPGVAPWQEIATVRLTYRSKADGRTKTEAQSVTARDLDKNWTTATRRHRLATLGAVWGESLRAESEGDDVARAAEELAEEAPSDDRARDLAAAATASSRLRSSAPTGSGR